MPGGYRTEGAGAARPGRNQEAEAGGKRKRKQGCWFREEKEKGQQEDGKQGNAAR
ncbi:unnamed protein product, partial [Amoebophrya sp. A120]